MKLKILFSALMLPLCMLAQEGQQSIELPDFIITGVRSVDIPTMKKVKPIPPQIQSDQVFTPIFTPEDLDITEFSNPIRKQIDLFQRQEKYSGNLKLGAGIYTLPEGDFYYNYDADDFLLFTSVFGKNETEYIDNAGYNVSGASAGIQYFVKSGTQFLNGLRLSGDVFFERDAFKFYGSQNPDLKRESYFGNGGIGIVNTLFKEFQYGLDFRYSGFFLKENNTKELLAETNLFLGSEFKTFELKFSGVYKYQTLYDNKFFDDRNGFISGHADIKVKPFKSLDASFGVYYAKQDSISLFSPTVSFNGKLDKSLTIFGKFSPDAEFALLKDITEKNRFYKIADVENLFIKNKANFEIAVKFQYETYFEIAGGARYKLTDGFPYFDDNDATPGEFGLNTVDGVSKFGAFINLLYHLGPGGYLYGEAEFQDIRDRNKMVLPYQSPLSAFVIYGYDFDFGLGFKTKLNYAWEMYTSLVNDKKTPHYINLGINLNYDIGSGFTVFADFENILNRDNYRFNGYKEKPFDIIGGIDYRW